MIIGERMRRREPASILTGDGTPPRHNKNAGRYRLLGSSHIAIDVETSAPRLVDRGATAVGRGNSRDRQSAVGVKAFEGDEADIDFGAGVEDLRRAVGAIGRVERAVRGEAEGTDARIVAVAAAATVVGAAGDG